MANAISAYDASTQSGHGVPPVAKYSYKLDAPLAGYTYELRENNLVDRVAESRKLGVSYGQYMAMLRDGAAADPLAEKE